MKSNYMAAFKDNDKLVVYMYDLKDDFIYDVNHGRFDGLKVIQTGILEEEVQEKVYRYQLSLQYIDCRN